MPLTDGLSASELAPVGRAASDRRSRDPGPYVDKVM